MAGIKIVTDSSSDIPLSVAHELGIEIVPLQIVVGNQSYRAGLDITADQFYQAMQENRAQIAVQPPPMTTFEQLYRRLTLEYDHIFSIHLSSRLVPGYRVAQQARSRLPASSSRVEIIDSKLISMALGMVVIHAARQARRRNPDRSCAVDQPADPALPSGLLR